jgi:hypothetical protein
MMRGLREHGARNEQRFKFQVAALFGLLPVTSLPRGAQVRAARRAAICSVFWGGPFFLGFEDGVARDFCFVESGNAARED